MIRSGRELRRSTGSSASGLPALKWVPAVEARCPPAEKPMMATRPGSTFHFAALARTNPDRAAGVVEHRGMMIARAEAVLENEGGDSQSVEPLGDLFSFVLDGQHHRSRRRGRRPRRHPWQLRARQPDRHRRHVLVGIGSLGTGCTAWPQLDHGVSVRGLDRRGTFELGVVKASTPIKPARIDGCRCARARTRWLMSWRCL